MSDVFDALARHSDAYELPVVSIRERTEDDPVDQPPIVAGGPRITLPRYLLFSPESGHLFLVFGIVQGGETREAAVYWAERFAYKQDYRYVPPEGWEDVVGALPEDE